MAVFLNDVPRLFFVRDVTPLFLENVVAGAVETARLDGPKSSLGARVRLARGVDPKFHVVSRKSRERTVRLPELWGNDVVGSYYGSVLRGPGTKIPSDQTARSRVHGVHGGEGSPVGAGPDRCCYLQ